MIAPGDRDDAWSPEVLHGTVAPEGQQLQMERSVLDDDGNDGSSLYVLHGPVAVAGLEIIFIRDIIIYIFLDKSYYIKYN